MKNIREISDFKVTKETVVISNYVTIPNKDSEEHKEYIEDLEEIDVEDTVYFEGFKNLLFTVDFISNLEKSKIKSAISKFDSFYEKWGNENTKKK